MARSPDTSQAPAPMARSPDTSQAPAPMARSPVTSQAPAPMARSPVSSQAPASASKVASCLKTLQSCIAATPDTASPVMGKSSYTLEGASFTPVPTSKKILNLFLAFLVVFFAMLMMMKNK
jgi:hypothetical protein